LTFAKKSNARKDFQNQKLNYFTFSFCSLSLRNHLVIEPHNTDPIIWLLCLNSSFTLFTFPKIPLEFIFYFVYFLLLVCFFLTFFTISFSSLLFLLSFPTSWEVCFLSSSVYFFFFIYFFSFFFLLLALFNSVTLLSSVFFQFVFPSLRSLWAYFCDDSLWKLSGCRIAPHSLSSLSFISTPC
jgi:hypothetical protein